jgi:hypothetical protein
MKRKNKKKSITSMINEMQMRREYNFAHRLILGWNNKEIHGATNITVHNR